MENTGHPSPTRAAASSDLADQEAPATTMDDVDQALASASHSETLEIPSTLYTEDPNMVKERVVHAPCDIEDRKRLRPSSDNGQASDNERAHKTRRQQRHDHEMVREGIRRNPHRAARPDFQQIRIRIQWLEATNNGQVGAVRPGFISVANNNPRPASPGHYDFFKSDPYVIGQPKLAPGEDAHNIRGPFDLNRQVVFRQHPRYAGPPDVPTSQITTHVPITTQSIPHDFLQLHPDRRALLYGQVDESIHMSPHQPPFNVRHAPKGDSHSLALPDDTEDDAPTRQLQVGWYIDLKGDPDLAADCIEREVRDLSAERSVSGESQVHWYLGTRNTDSIRSNSHEPESSSFMSGQNMANEVGVGLYIDERSSDRSSDMDYEDRMDIDELELERISPALKLRAEAPGHAGLGLRCVTQKDLSTNSQMDADEHSDLYYSDKSLMLTNDPPIDTLERMQAPPKQRVKALEGIDLRVAYEKLKRQANKLGKTGGRRKTRKKRVNELMEKFEDAIVQQQTLRGISPMPVSEPTAKPPVDLEVLHVTRRHVNGELRKHVNEQTAMKSNYVGRMAHYEKKIAEMREQIVLIDEGIQEVLDWRAGKA